MANKATEHSDDFESLFEPERPGKKKHKKHWLSTILCILLIGIGIGIYLYPDIQEWKAEERVSELKASFEQITLTSVEEIADADGESLTETTTASAMDGLYQEMLDYNTRLLTEGQQLTDAWSYTQTPISLSALPTDDGAVGYIEIPDMDVTLPLYLGATTENLSKGAAVLSETSMPIGGDGTNCVIAGHRGYQGIPFFRDIEDLDAGSLVYVTNPWETLTYEVTEIAIIDPNDINAILIQEDKDMVTLLTCHPYMGHSQYRYVVYCERVESPEDAALTEVIVTTETGEEQSPSTITVTEGIETTSSQDVIALEKQIREIVPIVIIGVVVLYIVCSAAHAIWRKHHKHSA